MQRTAKLLYLDDHKPFPVCVLFNSYRLLSCFHLRRSDIPLSTPIEITPSQPTEVNASFFFFSQARTNGGGLSTLKAFPHCRTNLQHHCPDQGHFCSKSKAKDGVVNRYPRVSVVHSFLAALSCVNYLQASARQFYGSMGHS